MRSEVIKRGVHNERNRNQDKNQLIQLIAGAIKKKGKRISNNALSREIPITYARVKKLRNDQLSRLDMVTLQRVLNFFNRHGLKVEPGDLLVWKQA